MNKKEYIFELIQSMTQGEKRYFKIIVASFEGKNKTYIKLFDAIDKQKEYDEKAIKKKFAKESFVNHFAVVKNNLFNLILKTLRFYHSKDDNREQVSHYKENFRILVYKGLHNLADSQLKKAMKLAEETERFADKVTLAHWHMNTVVHLAMDKPISTEMIETLTNKPLVYIEEMKNFHTYAKITNQLDIMLLQSNTRLPESQLKIRLFMTEPNLAPSAPTYSVLAKFYKHHARLSCYLALNDFENAYKEASLSIATLYNKPSLTKSQPFLLSSSYNNYLFLTTKTQSIKETERVAKQYQEYLLQLKKENVELHDYEVRLFHTSYFYKLEYYAIRAEFQAITPILEKVEKQLLSIKDQFNPFSFIYYHYFVAYAHFGLGNYTTAQKYVVELLNTAYLKNRKDYLAACHLLNLMIHYKLNHIEHLSYQLKNVKQLLQRQGYFYGFEKNVIAFVSKLYKVKNEIAKQKILAKYLAIFNQLAQQSSEVEPFERLNLIWLIKNDLL